MKYIKFTMSNTFFVRFFSFFIYAHLIKLIVVDVVVIAIENVQQHERCRFFFFYQDPSVLLFHRCRCNHN